MSDEVRGTAVPETPLVLPDTGPRRVMIIQLGLVTLIIAVLMSVMVPVFQQSRGAAKSVVCIATLQKLSRMMAMYLQDYDETYPPLPKGRDLAHSTRSFTR